MELAEVAILATGLAMDAAAVAMTNAMVYKRLQVQNIIIMVLFFALLQGTMPLFGYFAGSLLRNIISGGSRVFVFIILACIGLNMIRESFSREESGLRGVLTLGALFLQAIATSMDAFAVGVGFCAICVNITAAALLIAAVTAFWVFLGILIGRSYRSLPPGKAELVGGVILILLALKALFDF